MVGASSSSRASEVDPIANGYLSVPNFRGRILNTAISRRGIIGCPLFAHPSRLRASFRDLATACLEPLCAPEESRGQWDTPPAHTCTAPVFGSCISATCTRSLPPSFVPLRAPSRQLFTRHRCSRAIWNCESIFVYSILKEEPRAYIGRCTHGTRGARSYLRSKHSGLRVSASRIMNV